MSAFRVPAFAAGTVITHGESGLLNMGSRPVNDFVGCDAIVFDSSACGSAEKELGDKVFFCATHGGVESESGKNAVNDVALEAFHGGAVQTKDVIVDAMLQQIILRPKAYSVIATLNLNGEYISDVFAAQVGGIRIASSANINYESGISTFETTHGIAPQYTGLDKVNPSLMVLSGGKMLEYIGWQGSADLAVKRIERAATDKQVTYDFHRLIDDATLLKCSEYGSAVIEWM